MIESSFRRQLQPSNPFSTHRVRPGKIDYRFESVGGIEQFFVTLQRHCWIGLIVGPHGTGKSTLLKTLDPLWADVGRKPICVSLHNGQRHMPRIDWRFRGQEVQVIVDGFEQLSLLHRVLLYLRCRAAGCGLLVTAHRCVWGIPTLHTTATSPQLVRRLVAELTEDRIDMAIVDSCFHQADGNVRETFMLLYDTYCLSKPIGKGERHFPFG